MEVYWGCLALAKNFLVLSILFYYLNEWIYYLITIKFA